MALAGPADRVFAGLLRLLPAELRERHGREIAQVYRAEREDAGTRSERVVLWWRTAAGVVATAVPQHLGILRQDTAYALRGLWRSPSFTIPAILTLGISIGATIAMVGLVNAITFRPLPFAHADRVLYVDRWDTAQDGRPTRLRVPSRDLPSIQSRTDLFEAVAAHRRRAVTLRGPGGAAYVPAAIVSPGWSDLRLAEPALGRLFTPAEEAPANASHVAIVSWRVWTAQLGAPRNLDRARLTIEGEPYRVVGVLPEQFHFPYESDVWVPGEFPATALDLLVIARRRDHQPVETIDAALADVASRLASERGEPAGGSGFSVRSLRESVVGGGDRVAWMLLGAVAVLLLIASANVGHLLSVRFASRQREFGIRGALGANQRRQVRQCVTETSVLFGIATLVGLLLALWLRGALVMLVPQVLRAQFTGDAIPVDGRVAGCTAAIVFVLARVFGAIAARHAAPADIGAILKEDGLASGQGPRRRGLTASVAAAQVALAVILGSCAGFLVSGVDRSWRADLGFETRALLTFQLDFSSPRFTGGGARTEALEDVLSRIQAIPGVISAAASTVNPICCYDWGAYAAAERAGNAPDSERTAVHHRDVSPRFFEAMGIRVEQGRTFTPADADGAELVVIIDRRVADRFWPKQDPIGKRLRVADAPGEPWMRVVGVAAPVHDAGTYAGAWYVPLAQHAHRASAGRVHLFVKTAGDPLAPAPEVRRALAASGFGLAAYRMTTMDAQKSDRLARDRFAAVVLSSFAVFGLLLAAIGIYGVSAHGVQARLPEFGVRVVLGASRIGVLRLAIGRPLRLMMVGCASGALGAVLIGAVLERTVFNTTAADPWAIAGALAIAGGVTAAACGAPAVRAVSTPPLAAMRQRA